MTSDALQRLIAAVEAGEGVTAEVVCRTPLLGYARSMSAAYDGSLDAALALHSALLPGWGVVNLGQAVYPRTGPTVDWHCRLEGRGPSDGSYAIGIGPARALLLAILRAYQSQEASQ